MRMRRHGKAMRTGHALLAIAALAAAAASTAAPPMIAGCPIFPANNIWNVPVDTLPVHANSANFVASIGNNAGLHMDFGSGTWNGRPMGIPFTTVPSNQPKMPISFGYFDESDPGPYPIPADIPIEGGAAFPSGDRHGIVIETGTCTLYETYHLTQTPAWPATPTSWQAGAGAVWSLNSHALRPAGWTSADAAGLPILPGLIRYEEVAAGEITHALRFTADVTRKAYVWPARHFASNNTNPNVPAMGQRFRLKASKNLSGYSQDIQVIFTAFKRYGIILADNGSNWYIGGEHNPAWDDDILVSAFRTLKGADFEAVDVSSLMLSSDSGQIRSSVVFTPTHWVYAPSVSRP